MAKRRAAIRIGASGWHYRSWVGQFYPHDAKPPSFLGHYTERFDCVEVNSTFYRLPQRKTVEAWRAQVPEGFLFAVKASRFITHMKKLKNPDEPIRRMFSVIDGFGATLGPILFQLPPGWRANVERLRDFLAALPKGRRYAFELRDESWLCDEVFEALSQANAAHVLYDFDGRQPPERVTADFVYVRLHGPGARYKGSYSSPALAAWRERAERWRRQGLDVFVFFDNDEEGYAAADAERLQRMFAPQHSRRTSSRRK
jgi:uncharacterized protein YecE (DUF72 family)